jgi:hypothetical protein
MTSRSNRSRKSTRVKGREIRWRGSPDPLDLPLPPLGPNLTRLKRALWVTRSADALDRGHLGTAERLWVEACVEFIIDATRHPAEASSRYPKAGRHHEAHAPPSSGVRNATE